GVAGRSQASPKGICRKIARDQGSDANNVLASPTAETGVAFRVAAGARKILPTHYPVRAQAWQIWPRCAIWCQGLRETGTRRFPDAKLRLTQSGSCRLVCAIVK